MTTTAVATTNGDRAVTVRPQQPHVGTAAEQGRAVAEIQAALTCAKADRRYEIDCVDRIKNACQRHGLAERAEYVYSRGGTDITGPTIDLLTVIANLWGNIQFGFRELSQHNGESTVECFAWDLESNAKRVVVFTVPHKRTARGQTITLADPRDIYELVANQAQRRVRACLEAIIPPDVVEDAVQQCRETLAEKAQVTPESIGRTLEAFGKLGVTREQIEERLGRRMDAMQPAQLVSLRRIYKSITDGMSKVGDWFKAQDATEVEKPTTATEAAKAAMRAKQAAAQARPAQATEPAATDEQAPAEPVKTVTKRGPKPAPVTDGQLSRLRDYQLQLRIDAGDMAELLTPYHVDAIEQLTRAQADVLVAEMHARVEAGVREDNGVDEPPFSDGDQGGE